MTTERARGPSLRVRLGVGGALLLAIFLAAVGLVLDRSFQASAARAAQAQLEVHLLTLIAAAEPERDSVRLPDVLPDPRWQQPGGGLYGVAFDAGARRVWRSASLAGRPHDALVAPAPTVRGAIEHDRLDAVRLGALFRACIEVEFARGDGSGAAFRFVAAMSEASVQGEIESFRDTLWAGLGAVAGLMSAALWLLFRVVAQPLTRLANEVLAVDRGERDGLGAGWPAELAGVAASLDAFIVHERAQRTSYREMIENVAHSLKTPLSVLRNALAGEGLVRAEAVAQVERMETVLRERLSRIVVRPLRPLRVAVRPVLDDLARALGRIHPAHRVEVDCEDGVLFPGDEAHLHELAGNLADNACKYGRARVRLHARRDGAAFVLEVDDDGPGFPPGARESLLERGVRGDQRAAGQGLGLAIVAEIVEAYAGRLELLSIGAGARVRVTIP